jgi:hypothetical protein
MKKTICINGVYYTPKKFDPYAYSCVDLFQLYAKPSQEKIEIFRKWQEKLNRVYGVSGSKHCFTIYGNVRDDN